MRRNSRLIHRLLGSAGLLVALLSTGYAHAASKGCRSDPLVVLTNGIVLELSAAINDDVTDVKQITYTLHVPTSVGTAAVVTTDGEVKYHERFVLVNDSQPSASGTVYTAAVVVDTQTSGITAMATLAGGYATALGVTPDMVGLSAFTTDSSGTQPQGKTPTSAKVKVQALPSAMNAQVVAWAASAAWAQTAVSGTAVSSVDQPLTASIVL